MTPETAEKRALSRSRGSNPSSKNAQRAGVNGSSATRRRNQRRRRAKAALSEGRSEIRPAPQEAPNRTEKRKSGQITPQEPPRSKKIREDKPQEARGKGSNPNQQPTRAVSRKYSETVKSIRMAVLPRNYPAEALGSEQQTSLQNCLVKALFVGDEYTGAFNGIFFKGGMLLVDCQDEKSATWLTGTTPRLVGWNSPALCVKRGEDIPQLHSMAVFFPRSANENYDFALSLVKNQNLGLRTTAWKVVSSSVVGSGWNLNITVDDESYKYIRQKGFKLNFRFGKVVMRPWRPKATPTTDKEPATGMTAAPASSAASSAGQEATASVVAGERHESPNDLIPAEKAVTTGVDENRSNELPKEQESMLPSTQELLEGLDMQVDEDIADEDQSLIEPIL
ncbi:uncharacterized protein LOC126764870 [Bactrocera neohumeralis]|uniref:uncharacterized protein LOC126764870 n=1 Tax=Bactrocera neohumeralis TaxID=98809 RepID=UPI0021663C1C|nr:uncharacterized protein LOC126764870 [Bactrocera neohumeralis]